MLRSSSHLAAGIVTVASLFVQTGCSLIVNPNYDELSSSPLTMTPSERGVREAHVVAANQHVRSFETIPCPAHTGNITYGPLYFEDPFVLGGSDDDQFAWTLEEPFYYMLGPMRYGANIFFWPISAVVSPPWVPVAMADTGSTQENAPQEKEIADTSEDTEATP